MPDFCNVLISLRIASTYEVRYEYGYMAKKQKFYVVWEGHTIGILDNWTDCQRAVKGYQAAKYKSFLTLAEAQKAYAQSYYDFMAKQTKKTTPSRQRSATSEPNWYSIAVDAASSGNPGRVEYRGVDTQTRNVLFKQGPFPQGTNNIGEFLALVHGLAFLKKEKSDRILYTDSKTAMSWVRQKKCKTTLARTAKNKSLFELVDRAENWLRTQSYQTKIVKWETKIWGEIPADYGRK